MFHLQQTHFGKTKFLNFINNSQEGKIQSQHKYLEIATYRSFFLKIKINILQHKNLRIFNDIDKSIKIVNLHKKNPYY